MTKDLDVNASGAVVGETGLVNLGVGEEMLKGIIYSVVSESRGRGGGSGQEGDVI